MSKTYRVKLGTVVGESRDRRVVVCPPIVPEMPALLGAELAKAGWAIDDDGKTARKTVDAAELSIDLENPALELNAQATADVIGSSYDPADNDGRGDAAAREDAERRRPDFEREAKAKADRALMRAEEAVRDEVGGAVRAALLEALVRKAGQLGRAGDPVESVDADGQRVTTITVEV